MRVEKLWEKCLRVLQRHQPDLQRWRWQADADHLRLMLTLADGEQVLRIAPKGDGPRWFSTASSDVTLQSDGSPQRVSPVLEQLRQLVARADRGGLVFSLPKDAPKRAGPDARQAPEPDPTAVIALAPRLHWASFLAYKCITTEDLYPHVSPLGEVIDTPTLLEMWRDTVRRHRTGRAPEKVGLYVHVPFCTVECTFCYCAKTDAFRRGHVARYVDDLVAEARMFGPVFAGLPFTSLYFGGGTPSLLTPPQMQRLFATLFEQFTVPAGTQIIYEGNPDSLSDRKIEVMATTGRVSRLTIGVQTLDEEVQRTVRRHNTPEQVQGAVQSARKHGIGHVNVDLMAGLPGQTLESFLADLRFLLSCEPDSVHLNTYRPLPRVHLAKREDAAVTEAHIALRAEMQARAAELLDAAGHAASHGQGRRKTHNAANLQEYDLRRQNSSLLGLGVPSRAHAFGNAYYMPEFSRGFDTVRDPAAEVGQRHWRAVPADDAEEQHKYLVSNLHTGFDRAEYAGLFGHDVLERHGEVLADLAALGAVTISDTRVHSFTGGTAEAHILRGLLYSPAHDARARQVWGPEYDPDVDYETKLRQLVQS